MPEAAKGSFETDSEGNIILKPITGWTVAPAAEIVVMLAIRYVNQPEELKTGEQHQIQLVLMPHKCVELAEALTRAANAIRAPSVGPVN